MSSTSMRSQILSCKRKRKPSRRSNHPHLGAGRGLGKNLINVLQASTENHGLGNTGKEKMGVGWAVAKTELNGSRSDRLNRKIGLKVGLTVKKKKLIIIKGGVSLLSNVCVFLLSKRGWRLSQLVRASKSNNQRGKDKPCRQRWKAGWEGGRGHDGRTIPKRQRWGLPCPGWGGRRSRQHYRGEQRVKHRFWMTSPPPPKKKNKYIYVYIYI